MTATKEYGKGAALLSLGIGVTGLVTYGYFSLANHVLSDSQYGGITLLWSAVFMTVSILYRPVEQLLSKTIAERQALGLGGWAPLRVAATIQLGLGLVFLALVLLLRGPLESELFSGSATLYWIMVSAVLAYAVSYFARGFLAGQRLFGLYGALVLMEAGSRILFALAVAIGIASGMSAVALGIVAGPLISLLVVPWALGRRARQAMAPATDTGGQDKADELSLAHGTGFAVAVLVIMFSEQTFLNAGPLIVKATESTEGAALAGFVFSLLLVFRAPVQLFQAIATSLLPHLTNMRATAGRESFRRSVTVTVVAVAGFSLCVIAVLLAAGPQLMHIFFPKYDFDRIGLALVGGGMGVYLAAATLNQAALAQGQARRAAICWIASAALFVAWLSTVGIESVGRRVEIGFVLAACVLCGLLYLLYRRPHERPGDVPRPGSPQEVEARLAAADEAS